MVESKKAGWITGVRRMYKILIVEDDMVIAKGLASHLQQWGYDAVYVEDFKNVKDKFLECDPQLVLLDVILPYFNGFHWCQEIRKVSKVPIVFLSSANDLSLIHI